MLWDAGVAVRAKSATSALKLRLFAHTPSVTVIVIADAPVWPATGLTVIVRSAPEPPMIRLPFGRSDGLDELAVTCKVAAAVEPRFPKLKPIAPLEPPGGILMSGIFEICPAKALSPISKELLVVKRRNGAICSALEVPLVISSM